MNSKYAILLGTAVVTLFLFYRAIVPDGSRPVDPLLSQKEGAPPSLYWFIPDGLRAEPELFDLYAWAEEGLLPNVKRMMDRGTYGYSIPVFPGHTPTNFATLLTGAGPRIHGIADGPMHIEGYPLSIVSKGGFSSISKKVPPIWFTLENQGDLVTLLSVPGSTPPELSRGTTIRGRWGGWGLDIPAVNFNSAKDSDLRSILGHRDKVFQFGPRLNSFVEAREPLDWHMTLPRSYSEPREVQLHLWNLDIFAYIYDSEDDDRERYDSVLFSKDKKNELVILKTGEWSDWLPVTLGYETNNDYNIYTPKKAAWERELGTIKLDTELKIKVIRLGEKDAFRIRFVYDNLNEYLVQPSLLSGEIKENLGPMIDFVDNFPPQLIYYPEDKETFLEEAEMSFAWHRKAVGFLMDKTRSDAIIHNIYTPNQMLTSRWWMGYLDPQSPRYDRVSNDQRARLWTEVKSMYLQVDAILGEILDHAGPESIIVLSSDHGIIPLHTEVRLNNLFAREGLLKFSIDEKTGQYTIDWKNTVAVYLKMDGIYVNPEGLYGNYRRATGEKYEKLRAQVTRLLTDLKDKAGTNPVAKVVGWEDAEYMDLPEDRVGDLIIANNPGYGWVEDLTADLEVFAESLSSGYKQAVIPKDNKGMWTPFLIVGPGIRGNHRLSSPINHVDQYPTIMKALDREFPAFVEGEVLNEVFEP